MTLIERLKGMTEEESINEMYGNGIGFFKQHAIKLYLENYLKSKGYKARKYDRTFTAYLIRDVPERNEPILIDFGGLSIENKPVLNIVVRDVNNGNKHLNDYVLQLFGEFGIRDPKFEQNQEGTRIYHLRR